MSKATEAQKSATNPYHSCWVSANAGTGKTKVLINRLLALILAGNKPHKILCITFTKAAASEMTSRISSECRRLILLPDQKLKEDISDNLDIDYANVKIPKIRKIFSELIDNPELIKIQTIHSLCGSILKSFPLEAGIPPFFNTADDIQTKTYLENAWGKFVSSLSGSESNIAVESYRNLTKNLSPYTVKDIIFNLLYKRSEVNNIISYHGSLEKYLEFFREKHGVSLDENLEEKFLQNNKENIEKLAYLLAHGGTRATDRSKKLKKLLRKFSINEFLEQISVKDYIEKAIKEKHRESSDILADLLANANFAVDAILNQKVYFNSRDFLILFHEVQNFYEAQKAANYSLDYDDLIEKTARLLSNSEFKEWILYKLDGGIDHVLVDEAQDTSPSQWQVIKAIAADFFSGESKSKNSRTIFVVGDEKQSIYSFQGANIEVFRQVKTYFDKRIKESGEELKKIPLNYSFRSLPAVLAVVDRVFSEDNANKAVSSEIVNHHASRVNQLGYVEINELTPDPEVEKNKGKISWYLPEEYSPESENKKSILAAQIVNQIDRLVNETHIIPSVKRQCKAGDIIILFRKRDEELIELIEKHLLEKNIKTSGLDKLKLSENLAVADILAAMKFSFDKNDDYNTACLLKSPFIRISEEELLELCSNRNGQSLFEFLNQNNNLKNAKNFFNNIEKISSLAPSDFVSILLDTYGYRKNLIEEFGESVNLIIDEFADLINKFETQNVPSLRSFIKWFEANEVQIKRSNDSENDYVKIMTIHGSKGLEAPVVIMADTTSTTDKNSQLVIDNNFIFIPGSKDFSSAAANDAFNMQAFKENNESYRLLYVALTRAKDEIYIYGHENNRNKESWHKIIKSALSTMAGISEVEGKIILTGEDYQKFISSKTTSEVPQNNNYILPEFYFKNYREEISENIILPSLLNNKAYGQDEHFSPSSAEFVFERGNIIHKLLEVLPDIDKEKWGGAVEIIFKEYGVNDDNIKTELKSEVFNLLSNKEFEFVFYGKGKSEVPITGYVNGELVNGKIDRLVFNGDEIIIIDYKTHKNLVGENAKNLINNLTEKYKPQMDLYSKLLRLIYPDKNIKTGLLFTSVPRLVC